MVFRALLGLALYALIAAPSAAPAAAEGRACAVEAVEGPEVRVWTDGKWAPLREGQAVAFKSTVATGLETRVKIVCDDGIVVTVGPETEVNLGTLAASDRTVIVQLIEGIIGLVAPAGFEAFDVRTPLAIASVRSTEWLVEHAAADGSAVFVRHGRVVVRARAGGWFDLDAGEGITITPDGGPGEVKIWGPPRIARATEALGFDWR